ncbi:hypothetical protein GQ53DRAFT_755253 [Thozetella sp. PMI_491]|nr:hypothetical protein GQ53DRAFT_755253 [Thozetella sp. PMI_491]
MAGDGFLQSTSIEEGDDDAHRPTLQASAEGPLKRDRYYPLDIPDLPFCRYDHRRLTARDIMVHRIMAEYMNPSRISPRIYDNYISYPNTFDPVKSADEQLGLDLQLLRKLLFTSHADDNPPHTKPLVASLPPRNRPMPKGLHVPYVTRETATVVEGPRNRPPILGDQILDLVTRHYLETDDAALRTWIAFARPQRMAAAQPAQPVQQTGRQGKASTTRRGQFEEFGKILNEQGRREGKAWNQKDVDHLRTFQRQVGVQDELLLYDGGAFLPSLVQTRDEGSQGVNGTRRGVDLTHWAVTKRKYMKRTNDRLEMPTWPEKNPDIRFILQPAWRYRNDFKAMITDQMRRPLDLGLNPGRGRNRDGVWSTGQTPSRREGKQDPDGVYRGRQARIRQRSTSEPPPGSFTSANFPAADPSVTDILLQVQFPRMSLARLDARSRRRSLSRTRIEEMFDWDVSIVDRRSLVSSVPQTEDQEESPVEESVILELPTNPILEAQAPHSPASATSSAQAHGKGRKKGRKGKSPAEPVRCQNCFDMNHTTMSCKAPCGFCGAPNPSVHAQSPPPAPRDLNPRRSRFMQPPPAEPPVRPGPFEYQRAHLAFKCPVVRQNRCKCVPFPTWHLAASCSVPCKRDCGNPAPKGSFKHRNAMTCRARCCMCGLKGHSGKECRLRKCRCGGAHLGQDCNWQPTCRVKGCDRYWCGVHCRECGSGEKPFVGWRCWRCLGHPRPFPSKPSRKKGANPEDGEDMFPCDGPEEDCLDLEEMAERGGTQEADATAGPAVEAGPSSLFGDPRERLGV